MPKNVFLKDPSATLDYVWDWRAKTHGVADAVGDWLAVGETINTVSVTASAGLTVKSYSELDGAVTAWISGGSMPRGSVACEITTSMGRVDERSIILVIVDR